jgi:hypothetical protein
MAVSGDEALRTRGTDYHIMAGECHSHSQSLEHYVLQAIHLKQRGQGQNATSYQSHTVQTTWPCNFAKTSGIQCRPSH